SKKTLVSELSFSEATLGAIDSGYLALYAVGQFVNGVLGDRIGARRLLGLGLIGTAGCCALFSSSSSALAMIVIFALNGLFQATGWPGTTRAMAEWTTPRNRGTVMAFWSTCYQLGGIFANTLCGFLLVRFGWRSAFAAPAVILLLLGGLVLLLLPETRRVKATDDASAQEWRAQVAAAQREVAQSRVLWSYSGCYFFIKFVRYALVFWLPYYLSTTLSYRADTAAYVSNAFEIGGALGVIALGMSSDRLPRWSRSTFSALSLLGLALALFVYTRLAGMGLWFNALGLAAIGALLFGPDALLSGAAAQDAGGPHAAAAATGLVNGVGSVGALLVGLAVPAISRHWSWHALFPLLVVAALCACAALTPALLSRQKA
ncbi:MAG TPA: MFS transporter, partial [Polyangiales bacterium]|nr:MFS transporter [Polyangiales bacterium]